MVVLIKIADRLHNLRTIQSLPQNKKLKIASETNSFDIADSLNAICDKLITRHPHIYGDVNVEDEEELRIFLISLF